MAKKKRKLNGHEIFMEVLREEGERDEPAFRVLDNENLMTVRAKNDHAILIYEYASAHGQIAAMFDTLGFADYMTERCTELLDEFIKTATAKKVDGSAGKLSTLVTEQWRLELARIFSEQTMRAFVQYLQPKLWHALQEHELEMLVLARGWIERAFSGFLADVRTPVAARREADRLVGMIKDDRRLWLAKSLDLISGKPNYDRLKEHYERLLPKWQRAKTVYESISDLPNWRDTISQILEGENPDAFLIARVSGRLEDLPDKIKAAISEAGGDSSASSIAIEHAARLCGAKHYALNARTLFRKMQKAAGKQKVIKTKGVY